MIDSPAIALTEIQERALSKLPIEVAQALLRLRDRVVARFPSEIKHFILYGSFARGEAHEESDVDVMIVTTWPVKKLPGGWYESWYSDSRRNEILDIAYDATLECDRFVSAFVVGEILFQFGWEAAGEAQLEGIDLLHRSSSMILSGLEQEFAGEKIVRGPSAHYQAKEPADLTDPYLWLSMADDRLRAARFMLSGGFHHDVISNPYYAIFYAAKAALLSLHIEVKSHNGAISEFGKRFVKTQRVAGEFGRLLGKSKEDRIESDYYPIKRASQTEANEAIHNAEAFIAKARELVAEEISKK